MELMTSEELIEYASEIADEQNALVKKMAEAGLGREEIISKIREINPNFELSEAEAVKLGID